jgi:hypothetical protein
MVGGCPSTSHVGQFADAPANPQPPKYIFGHIEAGSCLIYFGTPTPFICQWGTPFWGGNAFVQEKQPANRRKGGGDQLAAINPRKEQPKRDACVYTEMAGDGQS